MELHRRGLIVGGAAMAMASPLHAVSTAPIRLSLNENAFGPSPAVMRAISAEASRLPRYVEPDDVGRLTAQIATIERVRPEQVILGEVLEPLGLVLAKQRPGGGTIVFSAPGYTALIDSAAPLGGRPAPVPLDPQLRNDLPALARAIAAETLAVSLINPHNPSGTVDNPAAYDGFIRAAQQRTLVVVDEAYLEYDDLAGRGAVRFVRDGANVLVFRTLAKAYGLAGLAIGYALAPASLIAEMKRAGIGAPHSLNRISVVAAAAALADQAHIHLVRDATIAQRNRLTATLEALKLRHTDSRANFVFFDGAARADAARSLFQTRRISIARPFPPLDTWLRVTVGLPAENDAVIAALETAFG